MWAREVVRDCADTRPHPHSAADGAGAAGCAGAMEVATGAKRAVNANFSEDVGSG